MTGAPAPRVLVTRAEPGAGATAARLTARGFTPTVEPLFAVRPLSVTLPAFDALAFTSANGVRVFVSLSARRETSVFCVGARTAEAAHEAGFSDVTSADGDVAALAALIAARLTPATRLLHTGNADSRGDLAGVLTAGGLAAAFLATYRAEAVAAAGPALAAHLAGQSAFDAVLIHSPRAAAILAGLAVASAGRAPLAIAAISQAAVAPLRVLAPNAEIAAAPDEDNLLLALDRLIARG